MIDSDGFRLNVGVILSNDLGQVLWAKRVHQDAWQFPQGGMNEGETPEEAMYRELYEEIGLRRKDVKILACTGGWLSYKLPEWLIRSRAKPRCIGQKQKWFLLKLLVSDDKICLTNSCKPEFDSWQWVSYWYPLAQVIDFKKDVYRKAMRELILRAPILNK